MAEDSCRDIHAAFKSVYMPKHNILLIIYSVIYGLESNTCTMKTYPCNFKREKLLYPVPRKQ